LLRFETNTTYELAVFAIFYAEMDIPADLS